MFNLNVQKTALVGFFIDVFVVLFSMWAVNNLDFSTMPEEIQVAMAAMSASSVFYLFHIGILAAQAAALYMISNRHRHGLVVAVISGCMLLPLSIVYLIGCTVSHYTNMYAPLYKRGESTGRLLNAFKGHVNKTYLGCAIGGTVFGMFVLPQFLLSSMLLSPILCFIAAFTYLSYRTGSNIALTLYDQGFAVFPHILALRTFIPYSSVSAATLMEDDSIRFDINTNQGTLSMKWALASVNPEQQRQALEELGLALHDNGVPLY